MASRLIHHDRINRDRSRISTCRPQAVSTYESEEQGSKELNFDVLSERWYAAWHICIFICSTPRIIYHLLKSVLRTVWNVLSRV